MVSLSTSSLHRPPGLPKFTDERQDGLLQGEGFPRISSLPSRIIVRVAHAAPVRAAHAAQRSKRPYKPLTPLRCVRGSDKHVTQIVPPCLDLEREGGRC